MLYDGYLKQSAIHFLVKTKSIHTAVILYTTVILSVFFMSLLNQ